MRLSRRALLLGAASAVIAARASPWRPAAQSFSAKSAMAEPFKPAGTVRLLLTGDVMLGRGVDQILPYHCDPELYEGYVRDARDYVGLAVDANGRLPAQRGAAYPWGFALSDMEAKAPDARIINLETAVTTHDEPWPRKGINYRMHPGNVPTLTSAKVDVCCLANNHTLDWREPGLLETLDCLHAAGIQTAGAGRGAAEAQRPAAVALPPASGGGRVLVWAVGHDSSGVPEGWAAKPGRPGMFYTDLSDADVQRLRQLVASEKQAGDVAVVSVHWGSNWGFGIPKEQRRFAHALIDRAGVDVVHGHSSHHMKGCELHSGKLVLYGCGDLISDYEGIRNAYIEQSYPPEQHRDDVGALWYADVSTEDGTLQQLLLTPTRLRRLNLDHPDPEDWDYVLSTLDREWGRRGAAGVRQLHDGQTVAVDFAPGVEE